VLERVTLGQTRFSMPGVSTDARGIAVGKLGVLAFPGLDGAVRWLRLFADEDSLDDLLPSMKIVRALTALKSRAILVVVPAASSYVLDRAARLARLAGGQTFTGSSKHFARYRDERSPYGYDAADLGAGAAAGVEYVLHDDDGSHAYAREGELDAAGLILRLSLRPVPGGEKLDEEARAQLYLTVAAGLSRGLLRYLLRNGVRAEVASFDAEKRSVFAAPGEGEGALLVRVRAPSARVVASLRGVPGVTWFRPVNDNVAVEVGYAHPIALASAASIFSRERFYLFRGAADRLDVVKGPPTFSAAEHLAELRFSAEEARVATPAAPAPEMGVELRLTAATTAARRVVGTMVPWSDAARLKKLVYALPPVLLAGHRVAPTGRGLLILGSEGVDVVPLGTLLTEIAPRVLVPAGMDLTPRVPDEVLAAALDHQLGAARDPGGRVTVFPHDGPPFFVPERDLVPLERRVLARVPVPPAERVGDVYGQAPVEAGGRIVNDAVGRFALWGFQSGSPKKIP
jgi:hypothetical protein